MGYPFHTYFVSLQRRICTAMGDMHSSNAPSFEHPRFNVSLAMMASARLQVQPSRIPFCHTLISVYPFKYSRLIESA